MRFTKGNLLLLFLISVYSFAVFSQNSEPDMEYLESKYRVKDGNLWIKNIGLAYPGMTNNSVMTDTVYYYNNWDQSMTLNFDRVPDFIQCTPVPDTLPPKSEGKLAITYSAVEKGEFGRIVDYFFIYTNDTVKPRKRILLSPTIKEDFSYLTDEERLNPPVAVLEELEYDFGSIDYGDTAIHYYPVSNKGARDLIIRATRATCGCTKAYAQNDTIPPGESSLIKVVFNSRGKKGEQKYHVNVITNDPVNPVHKLEIRGFVIGGK